MNCQLCQKNLDAYHEGRLSPDIRNQVESHLKTCDSCKQIYNVLLLADRVVEMERNTDTDPFLVTRVMAGIASLETAGHESESGFIRMLRPVLIAASMAAAVFLGVLAGNLSRPAGNTAEIPVELALINDAVLESVDVLSIE
ncbi:MAG: zf-HC2 domain-containing protein [Bacteroidales bacterium]|nr:zf-HC2 domain-containing protein [Bacteroidales bacterium]